MKKYIQTFLLIILSLNFIFIFSVTKVLANNEQVPNNQNPQIDYEDLTDEPIDQVHFMISKTEIAIGEQFTVAINNYTGTGVTSATIGISFDPDRFEVVSGLVFGEEAIYKNEKTGEYTISNFVKDAANPYTDRTIAIFTLIAKDNMSGPASIQLLNPKIGYGSITDIPMQLPIVNNEITFSVMNNNSSEIPTDPGIVVPDPTDPDEPFVPTESSYLEPEETTTSTTANKTEKPTTSTTTTKTEEPTTSTTANKTEKPTTSTTTTKTEEPTTSTTTNRTEEPTTSTTTTKTEEPTTPSSTGDDKANANGGNTESTQTNTIKNTEPTITQTNEETMKSLTIEIDKENVNIVNQNTTQSTEQTTSAQSENLEHDSSTAQTVSKELVLTNLETKSTEPTMSNEDTKETESDSKITKTNELENQEEKQARQEKAFELTDEESEIHNIVIMGGLALIALSSMGALGFMIFHGKFRPR